MVARPVGKTASGKTAYSIIGRAFDVNPPRIGDKIVPCGQCVGCRLKYSREWANRCMLELKYHEEAYFVTLTYDEEHVHRGYYADPDTGEAFENLTLCPEDLQLFLKNLRRQQEYHFPHAAQIRFFACGEYGSQTMRPHYHAIIFSLHLEDLEPFGRSFDGFQYYRSQYLEKIWKNGFVGVSQVSWETCAYVARYVMKKAKGIGSSFYETYNLVPEFVRMSRRPGIASQYFDDHKDEIYKYDEIYLSSETKGLKFKPPKYYDEKYDIEYPEQMSLLRNERLKVAKAMQEAKMKNFSGTYEEMLDNERAALISRANKLKRSI